MPARIIIPMKGHAMGCGRLILAIVFPPLAVLDRGCGAIVVVTLLTILGWIPGVIGAIVLNDREFRGYR